MCGKSYHQSKFSGGGVIVDTSGLCDEWQGYCRYSWSPLVGGGVIAVISGLL